jgi:hypothetical protein
MCMCVCAYECTYAYMYVCTYIRMYACIMYVCIYVCMYLCIYVCIYVCTFMCVCICMYVLRTYVCVCVRMCIFSNYLFVIRLVHQISQSTKTQQKVLQCVDIVNLHSREAIHLRNILCRSKPTTTRHIKTPYQVTSMTTARYIVARLPCFKG